MRYELLLQALQPGTDYDATPVSQGLATRGVALDGAGAGTWRLKDGEVEVRPLKEGGKVIATEVRVPLSEKTDLVRQVVIEASALAAEAQVRLFDPQLAREVSAKEEGLVADQFFRTARYAGEMLGVSEAIGASFAPPETGLKPGTKVMLGLIGGAILLYFIAMQFLGH